MVDVYDNHVMVYPVKVNPTKFPYLQLYKGADETVKVLVDEAEGYPMRETRIEGETCLYYPALINADHCDGFTISGEGVIDGHGAKTWEEFWTRRAAARKSGEDLRHGECDAALESFAFRRQLNTAITSLEEETAELLLETIDCARDVRLAAVENLRRLCNVLILRDKVEYLIIFVIDIHWFARRWSLSFASKSPNMRRVSTVV